MMLEHLKGARHHISAANETLRRARISATQRAKSEAHLGLVEMVARSKSDECPFCGDPRKTGTTKPHLTCGQPECKTAYHRHHKRDLRAKERR